MDDFQKKSVDEAIDKLGKIRKVQDLVDVGRHLTRMEAINQTWYLDAVGPPFKKKVDSLIAKKRKLLIIDTSMIFCECWFATKGVDSANASMMTTNSIIGSHQDVTPIMTLDCGPTWRHRELAAYKGDRSEKPPGFDEARKRFEEMIIESEISSVAMQDHESDDCMATICETASKLGHRSILVTRDTDAWQLLSDRVSIWHRRHGWKTVESLKAEDGLEPHQVVDYLCLAGKDCVPKAAGYGEKKSKALLAKYGSIVSSLDFCRGTTTLEISLQEFFKGDYMLARKLHTLNKALDIKWRW